MIESTQIPKLTTSQFNQLSKYIYENFGIKMPPIKKTMLESRLQKRLRATGLYSFEEYLDFVFSKKEEKAELIHMVDVVTTNKTEFFREPRHFDLMENEILPEITQGRASSNTIKIWSAGCSSGEEPYTIAFLMEDFVKNKGLTYSIMASDLSSEILQKAMNGVYKMDKIMAIPLETKKKYLLKSKDKSNPTVRIVPEIRKKVNFFRLNFMDDKYLVDDDLDIIFCRNVIIYFDRQTQEKVIRKLVSKLKPGGYLLIGHSESLSQMNLGIQPIIPTVFKKL